MDTVSDAFYNLFDRINSTFSKDNSDCVATLSSAIELLQFLIALPEAPDTEETVPFERTYLIGYNDLREVLKWETDKEHPLSALEGLLKAYAEEEETMKTVYESVMLMVSIMKSDEEQAKPDMIEPQLEMQYNLQAQFDLRQVAIACDGDDDRLSATYWLATPMGEDADDVSESVSVDFVEMSRKYCQVQNVVMNRLENTALTHCVLVSGL